MSDYDFSTLNDEEFEDLSIELISIDKGQRFETFKAGRDGGIDGRFIYDDGNTEIIQCKHYLGTGYSGLISSLKTKKNNINEIDKVNNLNPFKYIFTTSLSLSAKNKKEIKDLFHPHIKNENDIYGKKDLNSILSSNPEIEKKYYKLWLSSTTVLDRIINSALENRSESLLEDMKEKAKYYVITNNHKEAIEKIESTNILIIAGEAGIGKSTLADNICLHYIKEGFKFYDIEDSMNDAHSAYKKDVKQIFYFDDFLGATYLNAIENKTDSSVMKFINKIKKDNNKRFILTTRTNIFNQGIELSDKFKSGKIQKNEFILKIQSLKNIDKARILYNHLFFSQLNYKFREELFFEKRYRNIINHNNFNPRLIEFITDEERISDENIEVKDYWKYVKEKLSNPKDIWENSFDEGINEFGRILIVLTVLNGNRIKEEVLIDSYNRYIELANIQSVSHQSKDFNTVIKKVVRYFLNRNKFFSDNNYTLFNPSIADFVLNRYSKEEKKLKLYFRALQNNTSLSVLSSLKRNQIINTTLYSSILEELLKNSNVSDNTNYLISLYDKCIRIKDFNIDIKLLHKLVQGVINGNSNVTLVEEFYSIVNLFDVDDFNIDNFDFFDNIIFAIDKDIDEINCAINLYNYFNIDDSSIASELNYLISEYMKEELINDADSIYEHDVDFEESMNEEGQFEVVNDSVEDLIDSLYEDIENRIEYFNNIDIDEYDIKSSIEIDDIKSRLSSDYTYDKYQNYVNDNEDTNYSTSNSLDDIDDLFERFPRV
ncbi:hypothetical protein CRV02_00465 [Arcobacter sp. CECT 8989]|uniref:nSTAND3 domain-containing NTPase n=1 Tax=Arcobacter sp. CECT 8989 TaxID=2044509 RepID=UPI00100C326B|nr:hypothetical protein [Arcobacter sp. CECT 8989]RXK03704.1 hypothetical protein CRV02_00465 [Arcobacter sp. CECT 8989]